MLPEDNQAPPPDFDKLLEKYLRQECSETEKRQVENWYANLGEQKLTAVEEAEMGLLGDKLWHQIKSNTYQKPEPVITRKMWAVPGYLKYSAAAAVIIIGGWLTLLKTNLGQTLRFQEPVAVTAPNNTRQERIIYLPDSSQVTLQPGSQIRYTYQDSRNRLVYLTGEAFFIVKKNPQRPFLVHAGKVITKVLGTSFTVKMPADQQQEVEVAVKTGKVAVSNQDKLPNRRFLTNQHLTEAAVVLTPNQKAVFNPAKGNFAVDLVSAPTIIPQKKAVRKKFIFKDTPLPLVVQSLQDAYGIQIQLSDGLKKCPITADLSEEKFYTKIELICAALQARYQVKGTRVILTGKGCN